MSKDSQNVNISYADGSSSETPAVIENLVIDENKLAEAEQEEDIERQIRRNNIKNISQAEADLHMLGDRNVLAQITQLLSYIRHAVKNNAKTEITLRICNSDDTIANAEFMFDVNECQVPDCVPQPNWWIN